MSETIKAFLICLIVYALGFGMGVGSYSFKAYDVPDGVEYKLLRCETRRERVEAKLLRCNVDCARCSGQWEPSTFFGVREGDSTE